MKHELQQLPFAYDALEPHMDKETVEIHYSKHHQGYVNKLNAALEGNEELQAMSIEELLQNLDKAPEDIKQGVINNAGGVANHNLFWSILEKDKEYTGEIAQAINETFESFDNFKEQFSKAAATVFGSGWAWLVMSNGNLEIITTKNQDSPISQGMIPIIGLDVWEHAYYLKYQNKRPEYIENFFSIINWDKVNEIYTANKN